MQNWLKKSSLNYSQNQPFSFWAKTQNFLVTSCKSKAKPKISIGRSNGKPKLFPTRKHSTCTWMIFLSFYRRNVHMVYYSSLIQYTASASKAPSYPLDHFTHHHLRDDTDKLVGPNRFSLRTTVDSYFNSLAAHRTYWKDPKQLKCIHEPVPEKFSGQLLSLKCSFRISVINS